MNRLINLNSRPLDGISARGPPLSSRRSNGLHRVLVWPMAVTKALAREPSYEFVCRYSDEMQMETLCILSEQVRCDGELPLHSH